MLKLKMLEPIVLETSDGPVCLIMQNKHVCICAPDPVIIKRWSHCNDSEKQSLIEEHKLQEWKL